MPDDLAVPAVPVVDDDVHVGPAGQLAVPVGDGAQRRNDKERGEVALLPQVVQEGAGLRGVREGIEQKKNSFDTDTVTITVKIQGQRKRRGGRI